MGVANDNEDQINENLVLAIARWDEIREALESSELTPIEDLPISDSNLLQYLYQKKYLLTYSELSEQDKRVRKAILFDYEIKSRYINTISGKIEGIRKTLKDGVEDIEILKLKAEAKSLGYNLE